MKIKKEFYNIKCDCCNSLLDEKSWQKDEVLHEMMFDSNWKEFDGKHYCPDCWQYDGNNNIITKDGRVFDNE